MKTVQIFTDGACRGNQTEKNEGGYGALLIYKGKEKEIKGHSGNTTNNIMEMTAVIMALKALKEKDIQVEIYSDSAYVVNCFKQKWYVGWRKNGWKNSKKKPVENKELWMELLELVESFKKVNFFKVKGHLDLDKDADVIKWHEKFIKDNYAISLEDYKILASKNNIADRLANEGIDEKEEK